MANQVKKENNNSANQSNNNQQDIIGRTNDSQNPAVEKQDTQSDISHVDRQEGNLHHGEAGGGLKSEDD